MCPVSYGCYLKTPDKCVRDIFCAKDSKLGPIKCEAIQKTESPSERQCHMLHGVLGCVASLHVTAKPRQGDHTFQS